ncbi:MAG: hypothetical protein Q8Q23_02925 [bacterium]|nr:hypothetical protein [bacterium]
MVSLNIAVKTSTKSAKKLIIELDVNKFERIAASFGLFRDDFIDSIQRAEQDYRARRFKKIASLKDLRN